MNPMLISKNSRGSIYATLDFSRYLLLLSTLLNNYNAMYLVNNKELLDPVTFIKGRINNYVEVRTMSLLILRHSTHIIRNIIHGLNKLKTKDLILYNIIIIKGFHVNIISKA